LDTREHGHAIVTDPAGGVTRYSYDPTHRIVTITDPGGITFLANVYDPVTGRVTSQTQADQGVWTFAYTLSGTLVTDTTVTDPRGLRLYVGPVPPYTVSDIGDLNIRRAPIPQFDIYRFPTQLAARQFGIQDVPTIITIPASLSCPSGFTETR
jgi:YD repeat-containing protein